MATKRPKRPKPPRPRGRGEGSIVWREERQKFMAQTPRLEGGKRLYDYFDTEREAVAWLDATLDGIRRGRDIRSGRETLGSFLARWLDAAYAQPSGTTISGTRRKRRANIRYVGQIEGLAQTPLGALTGEHFQQIVALMQRWGRTERTIKGVIDTLKMALASAVEWRLIPENPVAVAISRGDPPPDKVAWSFDAVNLLLTLHADDPLMPAWKVGFSYGPRISDIAGLQWADIDTAAGTIRFSCSLANTGKARVSNKQRKGRTVIVGPPVLAALASLPRRGPWVFAKTPFEPWGIQYHRARFKEAVERTRDEQRRRGLVPSPVITPHGMRHTAATLMLTRGVPLPLVSEILGHASPDVTSRIYSHVIAEQRSVAADLISAMIP